MELFSYLIKVSASLAAFYLTYIFLLKKVTFFNLNRYYLVFSLILSFLLPFVQVEFFQQTEISKVISQTISNFEFSGPAAINNASDTVEKSVFNLQTFLLIIYFSGILAYVLKILIGTYKIRQAIRIGKITTYQDKKLVLVNNNWCFSLFNKIYINQNKLNGKSSKLMLDHELAHIKQLHSIDLLISELASAILWFNPFVFFHKKSLKSVHEYLADEYVINRNHSFAKYVETLIEQNYYRSFELAHDFRSSTIKNRVKMMTTNKSKTMNKVRYFLIIPLTLTLAILFTKSELLAQTAPPPPPPVKNSVGIPTPPLYPNEDFPDISPIDKSQISRVSNRWGEFINPITKKKSFHNGIDLAAKEGTPIIASADGKVVKAENDKGWGLFIQIQHKNGLETFYSHLSKIKISIDTEVKKGDIIGYVGNTGMSTGPHLHYSIKLDGEYINPEDYFPFK